MKRILVFLLICLILSGCDARIPPIITPPAIHTEFPAPTSTAPTNGAASLPTTVPETVPSATTEPTQETVPETTPEKTPTEVPETVPQVTEPGPQIIYADPGSVSLSARQAFVYDCSTGDLWIWGDMDAQIAPASLVKLFTVHVALELLEPDAVITAGDEVYMVGEGSSVAGIQKGDRLKVSMLVEGCLVQSGNDAAYVLAVAAGRKLLSDSNATASSALTAFMTHMNEKAKELELSNTYYVNPDGFDAAGQHTSPADVLSVARISLENPLVLRYCGLAQDHVTFESGEDYIWYNTNFLLHPELSCYCPDVFGLKTGTTGAAGAHLVAAFHAPGRDLLIGIFGCPDKNARFEEAVLLYNLAR